jgi:hypothetical protein
LFALLNVDIKFYFAKERYKFVLNWSKLLIN